VFKTGKTPHKISENLEGIQRLWPWAAQRLGFLGTQVKGGDWLREACHLKTRSAAPGLLDKKTKILSFLQ
jgi:hypothetical protein